jgi:ribosomal protection tetracycline resistance protein
MRSLNLGILAHVDAGKTSLTERLLFDAGVIDRVGSVDDGNTQTDTLALERQRGITIKSAVVSFQIDDITVNLLDTPGHPDFIAEVERVLNVLDGAVLVVSAVEGVQAQTRVLMRALGRLRIPTLIFVNKIDRRGADAERTLQHIAATLAPAVIAMGTTDEQGTRAARFTPYADDDEQYVAALVEALAEHDDAVLAAYVEHDGAIPPCHLRRELAAQTQHALLHPVFFGSAITGAGVDALRMGIAALLPTADGDANGAVRGSVFKIERGVAKEKIAYVRMFSGTIHTRDRLLFGKHHEGRVTALRVFGQGTAVGSTVVVAGQIGKLWGLGDVQIGDTVGAAPTNEEYHYFAPPTLETVITPHRPTDRSALHAALVQLTEQDPLINLRRDEIKGELFVSLYGEVQKEVLEETLRNDFGLDVLWSETTMICVERPTGTGAAVEVLGKGSNPFLATLGLRVEPAPPNTGLVLHLQARVETIPLYVYKSVEEFGRAIEETVRDTFSQGIYGWSVTDCIVTITHSGYASPATSAKDFRLLTPLVLMDALQEAGTAVHEPMHQFTLDIPADTYGVVAPALARLRATPQTQTLRGAAYVLHGTIPATQVHALQQQLPALTRGEGVLETTFGHYEAVRGEPPTRPRTDYNPLNRKEYLLHLARRV